MRRAELANGQSPFAAVLTCSDSRVVPTIMFDAGLGDLFEIRVAGNIASPVTVASFEFAVLELGCELIMVLGHGGCGAVKATLEATGPLPGQLAALSEAIAPSCECVLGTGPDDVETVIRENVRRQVEILRSTAPILADGVSAGRLSIVGARYDLVSGQVEVIA